MNSGAGGFQVGKSALAAALAVLLLALSGVLERTDRWWFDTLQALGAGSAPVADDTAMVLIDEQSLVALGQAPFAMRWPWPRAAFAALLAGLQAAGAERIAVDLIFFENSAAAEQDALLGAVAAGLKGVVLAAVPDRLPAVWPDEFRQAHPELFSGRARWGFVSSQPDTDSVIRAYFPRGSLAESMLEPGADGPIAPNASILLRWAGNLEQLRARDLTMVPAAPFVVAGWEILEQAMQASPDLDPVVLAAVINTAPPPAGEVFERVRGKTIFVGANAAATFDAIATPLGAPEPGIVLHWNAYANLQTGDFISALNPLVSWAAALAVIMLLQFSGRAVVSLRRTSVVLLASLLFVAAGSVGLFFAGLWFAPGLPIVAAMIGFTAVVVESFRVERARKQEIQGWFGAYVSPAVVNRLLADPNAIELGGEQRELTILFSDIAGFTTISERLPPAELVGLINRFLEDQTERILDRGGYLDKYIGDAIMAVFGSPEELENHALEACRAALDCRLALEQLNDEIEPQFGFRLGMRTGINTGYVVVGNVGSSRKRNYTVLGDAVNLASRLEGANKQTGTSILLGPVTSARVSEFMVLRPVARLQVKGKTRAVEVFELLGDRNGSDAATIDFAATFTRGFRAYCERDFAEAKVAFEMAAMKRPGDALSVHYLEETLSLVQSPPEPDWQAVLKLETK
jgi:adenylate cyclase